MRRSVHIIAVMGTWVVLCGLGTACSLGPDGKADSRDAAPSNTSIIQAHRGAGNLAPENTLPTFELAWRIGVVPEADVRTTSDGVIVAFHDATFERLVKNVQAELSKKSVADLTWTQAAQLDVGAYKGPAFAGQRIPRIADVFAAMQKRPERLLYLDIKDVRLEDLAEMARQHGVERQVILASTHDNLVRQWKELLPESQTLLWMGGSEARLTERLDKLRDTDFPGVTQLQVHVNVGDLAADDPFQPTSAFLRSVAETLRSRGILFQVLPRNTQDPAAYGRLMSLGVESFATDDPHVAVQAMADYRRQQHK